MRITRVLDARGTLREKTLRDTEHIKRTRSVFKALGHEEDLERAQRRPSNLKDEEPSDLKIKHG